MITKIIAKYGSEKHQNKLYDKIEDMPKGYIKYHNMWALQKYATDDKVQEKITGNYGDLNG